MALWGPALVIGVLAQGPSEVTAPWLPVDSGHPFSVVGHLWDDAEFQLNSWQFFNLACLVCSGQSHAHMGDQ